MAYRPRDYFGRLDQQAELFTTIKGSVRRNAISRTLEQGAVSEVPDFLKQAALDEDSREAWGSIHPEFLGGEYLADALDGELEIARITIRSTTSDVISVYARLVGKRIAYRVVDEYGGETLRGRARRTSMRPLTMDQLIEFFIGGWDLYCCLECNDPDDLPAMLRFFKGSSEFYPCFDAALRGLVKQRYSPSEVA
jgi:hypothetical protein